MVSPLPPRPPLQGPGLSPRVAVQCGGTQQCGCGELGVYGRCSWVLHNRQQSTGGHHVLAAGHRCSCASSRDRPWGHGETWSDTEMGSKAGPPTQHGAASPSVCKAASKLLSALNPPPNLRIGEATGRMLAVSNRPGQQRTPDPARGNRSSDCHPACFALAHGSGHEMLQVKGLRQPQHTGRPPEQPQLHRSPDPALLPPACPGLALSPRISNP